MKRTIIFLVFALFSCSCSAQIIFEKGYFIDNQGQKISCLIKNIDWRNNPTTFIYQLKENSEEKTETIENVQEFGIDDHSKYIRFSVQIDKSSNATEKLSSAINPDFEKETLFLKTLVEGKASLYVYEKNNLTRFFYTTDVVEITPLVYKRYRNQDNQIGKNERYKQQLLNDLKCPEMKTSVSIEYYQKALVKYFVNYDDCHNTPYVDFTKNQKKQLLSLSLKAGVGLASLSNTSPSAAGRDYHAPTKTNTRIGLMLELAMPFNKGKWSAIVEPAFQSFKVDSVKAEGVIDYFDDYVSVNYTSIEIPIGLRHYFFLNDQSKLFLNGFTIIDIPLSSKLDFAKKSDQTIVTGFNHFGIGAGYLFKKMSLEFRYSNNRDLIGGRPTFKTNYSRYAINFGYVLF